MNMGMKVALILILCLAVVLPASAFTLNGVKFTVGENGDTLVNAEYELSFTEYLTVALSNDLIKERVRGYAEEFLGKPVEINSIGSESAEGTIRGYATVDKGHYTTPEISLKEIRDKIMRSKYSMLSDVSLSPEEVDIVFPDGYTERMSGNVIKGIWH